MASDVKAVKALLAEMKDDDYVRFKYGKRLEAALKALETQPALEAQVLEARLLELVDLVRGKKGGSAATSASKSPRAPREKKHAAVSAHG